MDLKLFLIFSACLAHVYGQYTSQDLIDQTRVLQNIEKYGTNFTNSNLYPTLSNFSDGRGSNYNPTMNQTVNGQNFTRNDFNKTSPHTFNNTENFVNKTMSGMSNGVCVKEVP